MNVQSLVINAGNLVLWVLMLEGVGLTAWAAYKGIKWVVVGWVKAELRSHVNIHGHGS